MPLSKARMKERKQQERVKPMSNLKPCCEEHRHYMEARLQRDTLRPFKPNIEHLGITKVEAVQLIAKGLSKQTKDLGGKKVPLASMVFCGDVRLDELTSEI